MLLRETSGHCKQLAEKQDFAHTLHCSPCEALKHFLKSINRKQAFVFLRYTCETKPDNTASLKNKST